MWRPVEDLHPTIVVLTLVSLGFSLTGVIGILAVGLQAWDAGVLGLAIVLAGLLWTIPTHRVEIWDDAAETKGGPRS